MGERYVLHFREQCECDQPQNWLKVTVNLNIDLNFGFHITVLEPI